MHIKTYVNEGEEGTPQKKVMKIVTKDPENAFST